MTKADQRKLLSDKRNGLAAEDRALWSQQACEALVASPWWPPPGAVALFAAIRSEANPLPLEAAVTAAGRAVVYPRIESKALSFRRASFAELKPAGAFNILEPTTEHAELDPAWVITPGLGFTVAGARLGYGGGYYDRAVARLRADNPELRVIGFGFAAQLHDDLVVEAWDEPLNAVVTERGFAECGALAPAPAGRLPKRS